MKARRRWKRTLLCGALLMIMYIMLMLGGTMAWFEDQQIVINTFTFGELDVDIVNQADKTLASTAIQFIKPDGGTYEEDEYLFEPGATFQLKDFYVKNNGNVDFKYRIRLDSSKATGDEDCKLLKAMEFYATMDGEPFELETETNTLAAGKKSGAVRIMIHMKESAGNEYQNLAV